MKSAQTVLRHTAYQFLARLAVAAGGIITTILLTRYLGPLGYSKYAFAFTILWLFGFLTDFGLSTVLIREITQKRNNSAIKEAFTIRFFIAVTVFLLLSLTMHLLPYSPDVKQALLIVSLSQFMVTLSLIIWSEFQAHLQFARIALIQGAGAVLLLLLNVAGVFMEFSFTYFLWIHVAAALFTLLATIFIREQKHALFIFELKRLQHFLKKALPFAGWVLVTGTTFRIDMLILSFYRNPSITPDIGIYGLSYKFFEVSLIVGTLFSQSLYPYFGRLKGFVLIRESMRYLRYSTVLAIVLGTGLYYFAPLLVQWGGGQEFGEAVIPLQILSVASGLYLLTTYLLTVLTVFGKESFLLKSALAAFFLNVILNFVYIPSFSYIAASWTTLVTQAFLFVAFLLEYTYEAHRHSTD